jgi:phosphatidate cytidylyltransferase
MTLSSLGKRIATAAVLVPLVLAALFLLPPLGWGLVTLAIVAGGAYEWSRLAAFDARLAATFIACLVGFGLALLFADAMGFSQGWPDRVVVAVCGIAALFWVAIVPFWLRGQWRPASSIAMVVVGWIVLVATWLAIVELHARSPWLVLAAMAVVWIADTAAYFAGRRFGRRKLAPSISPNKTWEGVVGGLAAVALYAMLLVPLAPRAGYAGSIGLAAAIAFVAFVMALAAVSVVGDLFESMLKRQAGVKDSGTLLPGHGGVLDRVDALLSAMPLVALAAALALPKA